MSKDIDILKLKVQQREDAVHEKEREIKDAAIKLNEKQADYDMVNGEIEKAKNISAKEVLDLQGKIE